MQKHKLGFGHGTMIEHGDGTVSYRKPASLTTSFKVRIADVTGFTVSKGDEALTRKLRVLGHGTELAEVNVNHGAAEKVEAWFRAHSDFSGGAVTVATSSTQGEPPAVTSSLADELAKLASLRDTGILSDEEFAAQKAKLLS